MIRRPADEALVAFLREQLAVDEAIATAAMADDGGSPEGYAGAYDWLTSFFRPRFGEAAARLVTQFAVPGRQLAEVRVKRQIIDRHDAETTDYPPRFDEFDPHSITVCRGCRETRDRYTKPGCTELRLLALPFADRPGYREEWKP